MKSLEAHGEVEIDWDSEAEKRRRELLAASRATESIDVYMSLCRKWRKLDRTRPESGREPFRVALLSGTTTDFLELPIRVELDGFGLRCEVHRPNFNTHVSELVDPASSSVQFRPDVAVVLLDLVDVAEWPLAGATETEVQELVTRFVDHWLDLCRTFHTNSGADIILGNLRLPQPAENGNLGRRLPWDRASFVRRINLLLAERSPPFLHLLDVEFLSSIYGLKNWHDERLWHHAKQSVSLDCIVPLVRDIAGIAATIRGRVTKCIVLDLDNTIWGGVVGDDGVNGIRIGPGTADGEAFQAFQRYLLSLKQRGILLAACSKNEKTAALAPFELLDEMVLKRDDIVSFKASWGPKPDSIREIASELNIGLDSIVFVDDNPAERELVRQSLPEVRVLEVGDDPSQYPMLLSRSGWLETIGITGEDRQKSEQYSANRARTSAQESIVDYDSYLASLGQTAVIRPFEPAQTDRITQLINKTNQFNLTTLRMTRSEVETLATRPDAITAYMRLTDRFGDNGLISVAAGLVADNVLSIDLWLMSCRVFKRGVEFALANHLMKVAASRGVTEVRGVYRPTAKNGLVADFYGELGFSKEAEDERGSITWRLSLADYRPVPALIDIAEVSQ
jgi:FkbH-like protein